MSAKRNVMKYYDGIGSKAIDGQNWFSELFSEQEEVKTHMRKNVR